MIKDVCLLALLGAVLVAIGLVLILPIAAIIAILTFLIMGVLALL